MRINNYLVIVFLFRWSIRSILNMVVNGWWMKCRTIVNWNATLLPLICLLRHNDQMLHILNKWSLLELTLRLIRRLFDGRSNYFLVEMLISYHFPYEHAELSCHLLATHHQYPFVTFTILHPTHSHTANLVRHKTEFADLLQPNSLLGLFYLLEYVKRQIRNNTKIHKFLPKAIKHQQSIMTKNARIGFFRYNTVGNKLIPFIRDSQPTNLRSK